MFHLDTLRLIKKSFNRFFSLVMIVLIGVSFMMGLLSTRTIMEQSVDRYNDEYRLQDLQIYSSYGFDENDVEAVSKLEMVEYCFASRMADVFALSEGGERHVSRLEETRRDVNLFELVEGRMPEKIGEVVLMDNNMSSDTYHVGDVLTLSLDDKDIRDVLKTDRIEIVGFARSPAYMAKALGTSTLNNLELELVFYTLPSTFRSEYYTTIYLTVDGASGLQSFSSAYSELMTEKTNEFKVFSQRQEKILKDKLVDKYTREIQKNEALLEEKKQEAQEQLDAVQQQLDDANIQIIAGQAQLDSLNTVLATSKERLDALNRQYTDQYSGVDAQIQKVEKKYGKGFEQFYAELLSDYGTYTALKSMQGAAGEDIYAQRISELESDNASRRAHLQNDLYPERDRLQAVIADEETDAEEKAAAQEQLGIVLVQITEEEQQVEINQRLLDSYYELRDQMQANSTEEAMEALDKKYGGSVEKVYREITKLAQDRIAWEAVRTEVSLAAEAVDSVNAEISRTQEELDAGKAQYEAGVREYQEKLLEFNEEIEKAEAEIRKAYQDLDELPDASWIILDRDSHYSSFMFANNAKQMGAIGIAMPILFFLVAALVCMTTMSRLVDEQRGQIGIFRALGFSRGAVTGKYVLYAMVATLIGCTSGLFLGMAVFPTVIYRTWRLMYDLPDMLSLFPVENVIICYAAFSALISGVTAVVVNRTLSEVPSQLLRPKAPKNAKKVFLEYIPFIWKRLSFVSKITARNLIRYKGRFFMTVIGVAGCTALLVVGWGIKDSIKDVVAVQFGDIFNYDYMIHLENDHSIEEITERLESDLNNQFVTPYMSYSSKVYLEDSDHVLEVQVMDARAGNDVYHFRGTDHETELRLGNSGVLISEKFARNYGIKQGDFIVIESRNSLKAQVRVAEICEMYFQHYLFISSDYYEALFEEPIHFNTIAVKSESGDLDLTGIENLEGFENVMDFAMVTDQFNTMIRALDIIIMVIILTAGALALVVLINLTQVNISERIREIATLKVLGFRNYEVESYLFREIFLLSVIGACAGLPLGIVEHRFIMTVINMEMIMFGSNIKMWSFIYAFAVTLVFTLLVLMFTKRPLRKIQMIESLKSVE